MNQIFITGNCAGEMKLKATQTGLTICEFTIAQNYFRGKEKAVNFFQCVAFSKTAEFLGQYATKGSKLAISGELRQETWEKEGKKESRVKIIIDRAELMGGREEKPGSRFNPNEPENFQASSEQTDDLPF